MANMWQIIVEVEGGAHEYPFVLASSRESGHLLELGSFADCGS